MSDKESPIMVHDSDSESDSENLTEQVSGKDSEPMEGLNKINEGPVPNLPLLGTECTENQKESEELVLQGDQHVLPSGSKIRQEGLTVEPIMVDSSDDEDEAQVLAQPSPSLQFQDLEGVGMLLEEQNAQSHNRTQAGSAMLEGEQETSESGQERAENGIQGSVLHPPSIKMNVIQLGPVSNLQVLDTQLTDNQNQSEEFVSLHVESDQHASGSNLRLEGSDLAPSVHSLERQSHEQNTPLKTDCTKNQKDLVIPSENYVLLSCTKASHLENQTESECQATGRNPKQAAGQNSVTQGPVLNPPGIPTIDPVSQGSDLQCTERPTHGRNEESVNRSTLNTTHADFETRLLSQSLQSKGLSGAGSLLEEMKKQNQIRGCLENQTNCTVSEAEQCASDTSIEHTQSNYTEGSIPNVMLPGIEDRLLSQSLQNKGLEGAGRLLEEMHMQRQIPPRAEYTENQTNCMVQVMKKQIMHKPTTQTDQSEPIVVDSSDDEHEAQVSVPLSPHLQLRGLEGVGMLTEDENTHCSYDEDEAQVLVPLSPSMQFQGLEEERRPLEEQNPQSHIQIQRELECTKNQIGTIMLEVGQATSMSDSVTAEDPNNITQCPVSNKPGIQERDMDCTVNEEVYVTPEDGQQESGIDIRPAVGIYDRDIPQRGRKRGLSPDPSPSKRKFIRTKRDESYHEQCLYAIILPFQCPSNQIVVKVGVSGNPKKRFDKIKWGLKAIIPDEFAEHAELTLKDGICLSRTTPADKIIDEIFVSRIRMQAVEHQKAELEVRNLIMAAKNIDRDFTMSLEEAIYDTSDTREEADKKIHRINDNCGPTEWILCDTRTVEALRNAYKNSELDGTAKSMMDDKCMWGSYQEFIGELQKVKRNVYQ